MAYNKPLVRRFLNEIFRIELRKIRILDDEDLEFLFRKAVRLWKPEWSEHSVRVVANFLTGIFGIYEEEERFIR